MSNYKKYIYLAALGSMLFWIFILIKYLERYLLDTTNSLHIMATILRIFEFRNVPRLIFKNNSGAYNKTYPCQIFFVLRIML